MERLKHFLKQGMTYIGRYDFYLVPNVRMVLQSMAKMVWVVWLEAKGKLVIVCKIPSAFLSIREIKINCELVEEVSNFEQCN